MIGDPTQYRTAENLQSRIDLHSRFSTAELTWFEWLSDLLDLKPGMRVLDVGSGPGTLWGTMDAGTLAEVDVILLDLSIGMARAARASGHRCVVSEAEALPFPDDCFDVVIAAHMLYHVHRLEVAIEELSRVVKSGGRLIAATNGAGHMLELDGLTEKDPLPLSFSLENGTDWLFPHFDLVRLELYDDELRITDSTPAVDYLRSYRPLDDDELVAIRATIDAAIAQRGWFGVTKSTGAFIATGSRNAGK